jgi:hypothetical protein
MIRVVLHANDVLQTSSVMEAVIDALFDRMPQTSIIVCVRRISSEPRYE